MYQTLLVTLFLECSHFTDETTKPRLCLLKLGEIKWGSTQKALSPELGTYETWSQSYPLVSLMERDWIQIGGNLGHHAEFGL